MNKPAGLFKKSLKAYLPRLDQESPRMEGDSMTFRAKASGLFYPVRDSPTMLVQLQGYSFCTASA